MNTSRFPTLSAVAVAATLTFAWSAPAHADVNADGRPDVLWLNRLTGQVGVWLLNGSKVVGTPNLSLKCGPSDGCSQSWRPVGPMGLSRVLWHNPTTGELDSWQLTGTTVSATSTLDLKCGPTNGCSQSWNAVGTGAFHTGNYIGGDVLWHNPTTGDVGVWMVDGTKVETQTINLKCGPSNGCSPSWKVVGVSRHGAPAILWHNTTTGELSFWRMKDTPSVHPTPAGQVRVPYYTTVASTTPFLSLKCAADCVTNWKVVGVDDVNGDGKDDVLWFNKQTGEVSAWLLNGSTVVGTMPLSIKCAPSNCSNEWSPLGLMTGK